MQLLNFNFKMLICFVVQLCIIANFVPSYKLQQQWHYNNSLIHPRMSKMGVKMMTNQGAYKCLPYVELEHICCHFQEGIVENYIEILRNGFLWHLCALICFM